jgi:hypothetical protein
VRKQLKRAPRRQLKQKRMPLQLKQKRTLTLPPQRKKRMKRASPKPQKNREKKPQQICGLDALRLRLQKMRPT